MPEIVVVRNPELELVDAIRNGLRAYNANFVGASTADRFAVIVRDDAGVAVGAAVLKAAEAHALAHGCTASYLDTFEFQARGFYESQGYTVFGVQDGYPPGSRRFYLQKQLGADRPRENAR